MTRRPSPPDLDEVQQCVDDLIEYFEKDEDLNPESNEDEQSEDSGEKQNKAQLLLKNRFVRRVLCQKME